ncbi:MAG: hypothetical protein QXE81_03290 [Desulfurococcaceae archaeon]
MIIKGIHYGLTLLYSYLLPVMDVEDRPGGFRFRIKSKLIGSFNCLFYEDKLETTCKIDDVSDPCVIQRVLGIEKNNLFQELCRYIGYEKCIFEQITLLYEPLLKKHIAYAIYLSRNTDFYANTIRWVKEYIATGFIRSSSYIPREFIKNKDRIDNVLEGGNQPIVEAMELLKIDGFGLKSIKAFLLHAYGFTDQAPIDTHYSEFLGSRRRVMVNKDHCITIALNCVSCRKNCIYRNTIRKFGKYNGIIQSLSYIIAKLKKHVRPELLDVLVKNIDHYVEELEGGLLMIKDRFLEQTR